MKRYHFPLERILELKKYAEEEWELKLAEVTSRIIALESELKEIAQKKVVAQQELTQQLGDMDAILRYNLYQQRLAGRAEKVMSQIAEVEEERAFIREGYNKASRERKVFDKLKEKKGMQFHKEQLMQDAKELDEMGTIHAIRHIERRDL